jgi:drug/metabolite transporter (DMT)-like permease
MTSSSEGGTPEAPRLSANRTIGYGAAAYIIALCVLFGANAVAVKVAFEGFGVFSVAVIRFSIAAMVIAIWALMSGRSLRPKDGQWKPLMIYSALFTAQLSLFYLGLNRTHASRGTLLINMLPFLILILAHFFIPGERFTRRNLIGLILGFSGVACVFSGDDAISSTIYAGDGMVLLATLIWACNTVFIKRIIGGFAPFHIVLYSMVFGLPFFLLQAYWFDDAVLKYFSMRALLAVIYQTFVTASFGFIAWNSMLKIYGAVTLHSFVFIMPLVGVVLSGWILSEPLYPNLWLALVLIAAGMMVIHHKPAAELPTFPPRRPM